MTALDNDGQDHANAFRYRNDRQWSGLLPEKAERLAEYMHELTTFPNGKFDDQVDSTSQALDWVRGGTNIATDCSSTTNN